MKKHKQGHTVTDTHKHFCKEKKMFVLYDTRRLWTAMEENGCTFLRNIFWINDSMMLGLLRKDDSLKKLKSSSMECIFWRFNLL